MAEKSISAKMCELVQGIDYITNLDKFIKVLDERDCILKWAYCIHDKDVDKDGSLKRKHIHIYMRFKDSNTFSWIASWFGVPENCISKIQSPRFDGALPYLVHANAPDKYQYDVSEVYANFDYKAFLEKWKKSKTSKARNKSKSEEQIKLDEIIEKIGAGEIRRFNICNPELVDIHLYAKYESQINRAFKYREEYLKGEKRDMECIYIVGGSGTGKTTYAKELAEKLGYSYYISSGSNDVLDDYGGQDCLILDDLRPSCLGLSDLLKLLDNHTNSTVKSRYYNKTLYCKLVIITTVKSLDVFFKGVFEHEEEPIIQLKRRCQMYYEFTDDKIRIYTYDSIEQDYVYVGTIKNPIKDRYPNKHVDVQQVREKLKALFSDMEFIEDEPIKEKKEKGNVIAYREAIDVNSDDLKNLE